MHNFVLNDEFVLNDIANDLPASITAACVLEVLAPKAGNVHPHARFADLHAGHFFRSAVAIAAPLAQASQLGVGRAVYEATRAMSLAARTNTHLGTILLMAPLAAATSMDPKGIHSVLTRLGPADARWVYQAIRLVRPGGLGRTDQHDIAGAPPPDLLSAMAIAADRDSVARQYTNDFHDVFSTALPLLLDNKHDLLTRICRAHITLIAQLGDSLILRKCGEETAAEASQKAQEICGRWRRGQDAAAQYTAFDRWLRADGHRRNPGTTADLIAAALLVALRTGRLTP